MKVVLDTSVLIDYFRADKGPLLDILQSKSSGGAYVFIPTIVISELWAGNSMSRKKEVQKVERLIKSFDVVDLNMQTAKLAGGLRRKKMVGGFDSFIAATALQLDAQLATGNRKHFEKVKGLRFFA
jgi:predicted nucleic acid-binding protein